MSVQMTGKQLCNSIEIHMMEQSARKGTGMVMTDHSTQTANTHNHADADKPR